MNARDVAALPPDEREAFHRAAEARVTTNRFAPPLPDGRPKAITSISRTPLLRVNVQTIREGGENNLHYHLNQDTTWMVLRGGVRFYGPGDTLIAELAPLESITLPGGARYWFEKVGDEDLDILQMVGIDRNGDATARINVEAHKSWMEDDYLKVYEPSST